MTEFEICQEFRQSKEPRKQIEILADLNTCSKREIAEILLRNGCEGVPKYYDNARAAENMAKKPGKMPEETDTRENGDAAAEGEEVREDAVPPTGETEPETAQGKTTPATNYVDAQGLFAMMASLNDMEQLKGMPVIVNGKRVGCASISGWWNPRDRRVSWVLDLTV